MLKILPFLAVLVLFPAALASTSVADSGSLSKIQRLRIEEITNFFENSTIEFQYGYIENLHDGRGYTAGRVGFCTGTGDLYLVVRMYCNLTSSGPVCPFLPRLKEIADAAEHMPDGNPDISGLEGFHRKWVEAAQDPLFRKSQDRIVEKLYFNPAMRRARNLGLQTPIGKAIFYDTIIQHGEGDSSTQPYEDDSLMALIGRTQLEMKFSPKREIEWLEKFLDVRRKDLLNPVDQASQTVWAQSVDRVDKLRSILDEDKNIDLDRPVQMSEHDWTD